MSKQGYPDVGSGRYSKNFSYKEWYNFNMAQNQHMSNLSLVWSVALMCLVAGVKFPFAAFWCGVLYFASKMTVFLPTGSKAATISFPKFFGFIFGTGAQIALMYYSVKSCF